MIATRRNQTRVEDDVDEAEETAPLTGYSNNNNNSNSSSTKNAFSRGLPNTIFAGLNFPSVPTNQIIISRENRKSTEELIDEPPNYEDFAYSTREHNIDNREEDFVDVIDDERPLLEYISTSHYVEETASAPSVIFEEPNIIDRKEIELKTITIKPNLSKLYPSSETSSNVSSRSMYPEIPEMTRHYTQNLQHPTSVKVEESSLNDAATLMEYQESIVRENSSPFIASSGNFVATSSASSNRSTSLSSTASSGAQSTRAGTGTDNGNGTQTENELLIQDLIIQNNKLTEEVGELRNIISGTQSGINTGTSQSQVRSYTLPAPSPFIGSVVGMTLNAPAQGELMEGRVQSPEFARLNKYICCGSCQQWISGPKLAKFVTCPGCSSVNDCTATRGEGSEEIRRVEAEGRLSSVPWYMKCLEGFM